MTDEQVKRGRIAAIAAVGAIVGLLGIVGLVYTPAGLRLAESIARTRIGDVTYESLSGTLAGPLRIENVTVPTPTGTWHVESARLAWKPWSLLRGRVTVETLHVDGIRNDPANTTAPLERTAAASGAPIPISVDSLLVSDVEVPLEDPITLRSVTVARLRIDDEVTWEEVVAVWDQGSARATGSVYLDGSERFVLDASVDASVDGHHVVGRGRGTGSPDSVQLSLEASQPIAGTLDGFALDLRGIPHFDVDIALAATDHTVLTAIAQSDAALPPGRTAARLRVTGTPSDARVSGRLDFELIQYGEVVAEVDGLLRDSVAEVGNLVVTRGRQRVEGSGSSTIHPPFDFDAEVRWSDIGWPLDEPTVSSGEGRLRLRGTSTDFAAEGRGQWRHASGIEGEVAGRGQRAGDLVLIDTVSVEMLDGRIEGRGRLTLGSVPRWDASVAMDEVSTAMWARENPALLGSLSGHGTVSGALGPSALDVRATVDTITGPLGSAELNASTSLEGHVPRSADGFDLQGARGRFEWLEALWGSNSLFVTGVFADSVNGRVTMRAPRLEEVLPGASGSIEVTGRLQGPRRGFGVTATALGTSLRLDSMSVDTVTADVELGVGAGGEAAGVVTAKDLRIGQFELDSVLLDVTGLRDDHTIRLTAAAPPGEVHAAASGRLSDSVWTASVDQWDWLLAGPGDWTLDGEAGVVASSARSSVTDACWTSGLSHVCVDASREADRSLQARIEADGVPLASLTATRFPQTVWDGTASASVDFGLDPDGLLTLSSRVDVGEGNVTFSTGGGGRTLSFPATSFTASADSTGGNMSGAFLLLDPNAGEVARFSTRAETSSPLGLDIDWASLPVRASLEAEVELPAATARDLPVSLDSLEGLVEVDLDVTGSVGAPRIDGYARWTGGSFVVPSLGTRVTAVDVSASGAGLDGFVVDGSFRAGGEATIGGTVPLRQGASGRVRIAGEGLLLASMPDLTIESDLDLEATVTADSLRLTGGVEVTRASVELAEIATGVVRPSTDVVVVDDTTASNRIRAVTTDLRLTLGDSVSFTGFGVAARSAGSITVRGPTTAPVASGEISLNDGTYRAFGQQLDIERGRFLFAGGPLMDPGLDVRAGREATDGVVAGVEVSGTLRRPEFSLYSTPTMTEAEALSYVVLGRPLSDAGSTEDGRLVNAAASAGLRRSNALTSRIAPLLGLSEVRVDADGPLEEAALVAGRQFSSRLYVSYGVGLFQPVSTFRIRYMLSRRWTLLAESGAATGADLLYRIERGR